MLLEMFWSAGGDEFGGAGVAAGVLTRSRSRSMPNPRLVLSVAFRDIIESV